MPRQRLSQYHAGPAIFTYRGVSFFTKDGFNLDWLVETFPVTVDNYQKIDERIRQIPTKITFTPAGQWTLAILKVVYDLCRQDYGDYVTPVRTMGTITANVVSIPNHRLLTGDAVYANPEVTGSTLPTGLTQGTLYYIRSVTVDSISFHPTRADAVAGTNIISISGGTGINRITVNNPCVIQNTDGRRYTFANAAITKMPNINLTAGATPLEEMEISFFLKDNADMSDADAMYVLDTNAYPGDGGIDPATVLTQSPAVSWGAVAPWASFNTKDGLKINFAQTYRDIEVDGLPIVTKQFNNLDVTATATPVGPDQGDVPSKLLVQGTGAAIGRSLASNGAQLTAQSTGMYVALPFAGLRGGAEQFSVTKERLGVMTWVATRTFDSNGKPRPVIVVSTDVALT